MTSCQGYLVGGCTKDTQKRRNCSTYQLSDVGANFDVLVKVLQFSWKGIVFEQLNNEQK